ncbi:hypothetical protein D3C80_657660 [compost metagenome]
MITQGGVGFLDVHAVEADAGAQAGELFRGQLINEEHHRGGLRIDAQHFVIRANGRSHQHRGPAIEQHVLGDLLAFGGNIARLGDDRGQRVLYICTGRRFAQLALEQRVLGDLVVDNEHPFVAAGGVERIADVLLFIGPVQVGAAIEVIVGGVPYRIAGEELARRLQALLQGLMGVEAAFFPLVGIERGGDIEQCPQGDQAGQGEQRRYRGNEFARLQAGALAGWRSIGNPVHTRADPC